MSDHGSGTHDKRYHSAAPKLRAPGRLALLEIPRVVALCREGIEMATVLDVGTGTAVFAEAFAAESFRVTGIDPQEGLLAAAREHAPAVTFRSGTAEDLPFANASFDLVFLGHVLHETDDPAKALAEARRVALRRVAVLEWPYVEEERGPPLAHRLTPERIVELATTAGFAAVERIEMSHMHLYRLTP
jgi:ubiquinone/menaquinone biosynthesis C-methylase UbiE